MIPPVDDLKYDFYVRFGTCLRFFALGFSGVSHTGRLAARHDKYFYFLT
jgi:hypothetical protein